MDILQTFGGLFVVLGPSLVLTHTNYTYATFTLDTYNCWKQRKITFFGDWIGNIISYFIFWFNFFIKFRIPIFDRQSGSLVILYAFFRALPVMRKSYGKIQNITFKYYTQTFWKIITSFPNVLFENCLSTNIILQNKYGPLKCSALDTSTYVSTHRLITPLESGYTRICASSVEVSTVVLSGVTERGHADETPSL